MTSSPGGVTSDTGLVLLPSARQRTDLWTAVSAGLGGGHRLLTPELSALGLQPGQPVDLPQAAVRLGSALEEARLSPAVLCGVGVGALVALQLAVDQPVRVSGLVLITRQVRVAPVLMSLPAAVLRLLPASRVQRLGLPASHVLSLLDQVRGVDTRILAPGVGAPAGVVCGARDQVNRHASATLARALPRGELRLLPGAGPDWLRNQPQLLTEVLADALDPRRHG